MRSGSKQAVVAEALRVISERRNPPGSFFRVWASAQRVAEYAGVSVACARKHLNYLCHPTYPFRGYRVLRQKGRLGYLYQAPSA